MSISEKSCRKQGRDFDMTTAMMLWCSQLYGTYQIAYKYSHHWAEAYFQENAEKGPLVGSLQLSLKFLCSLSLQAKI